MQGPDDDFREYVAGRSEEIDSEDALEALLADIENRVRGDLDRPPAATLEDELGAIDSWAAVASHAVARFHAPASPWPRSVAGWGQRAAARLRGIAGVLSAALARLKTALGAASYSISVSFPWAFRSPSARRAGPAVPVTLDQQLR